ncbi:MAG: hypothetical protein P4L82_22750 [Ancalomicrobiaceae bacterium]|nr:hypothetical protein [Ancalomicrobiaceae bacterium]
MRASLAVFVGLLGLVAGYCLTGLVAYWIAGRFGMSDFEGGRGMFAGFVAAPIGAIVCLIGGAVVGWHIGRRRLTPTSLLLVFLLAALTCGLAVGLWEGG